MLIKLKRFSNVKVDENDPKRIWGWILVAANNGHQELLYTKSRSCRCRTKSTAEKHLEKFIDMEFSFKNSEVIQKKILNFDKDGDEIVASLKKEYPKALVQGL